MISIDEARGRILEGLSPTGAETVALAEAQGRILAADITARVSNPPADVSAMDGYALLAADTGPREVIGEAPAGHPFPGQVGAGQAVRLFTGSFVPEGADSIAIQEDCTRLGTTLTVNESPRPGQHIRRKGQDFAAGDVMITAGARLSPRHIGLIAASNTPWVAVRRRPEVAILATGDEIALPGDPIPAGGIVSSNAHALAALVRACGGTPLILPIAADNRNAIATAALSARRCDLLVTTGGASVGDHDLVASALAEQGMVLDFWKIAMRPGKPLMHGRLGDLPLLGLPGNPVSAYLCAVLFLKPAIEKLLGLPGHAPTPVAARVTADLPENDLRFDHLRCRLHTAEDGTLEAIPAARQDSSMMRTLAISDGVILRPPFAKALSAGAKVNVLRLDFMGL